MLKKANGSGVRCSVLTKGNLPEKLAELPLENEYGITVVSLDAAFIGQYEPGAAPIQERIASLKKLHDRGCKTWVSIEPYPTPNIIQQNLADILESISFVDKIIFGRLHYNKVVSQYKNHKEFYNRCAAQVIQFCNDRQIEFHIKNGTITEKEDK